MSLPTRSSPRAKVIEYTGECVARRESVRRWDPRRSYLFQVDDYWQLDGAIGGSGAELINHSWAPNLVARLSRGRLYYISNRRIPRNEELTYDYKYDARLPPIPCRCGAGSCPAPLTDYKTDGDPGDNPRPPPRL